MPTLWRRSSPWAASYSPGSTLPPGRLPGLAARESAVLECAVEDPSTEWAQALLDVPWELLADSSDFLASDAIQPFVVFRSVGRAADAEPAKPLNQDLSVIFMAAAPEGASELDYEEEESGILVATAQLPLQLWVEESGCARFFEQRLAQEGPFEAVHLSCHGAIGKHGPLLALESPEGDLELITAGQLAEALGEEKPGLVFLSACSTAEPAIGAPGRSADSFACSLVRAGVPNVIGWDGSVYDRDASRFAHNLYEQLAAYRTLPYAVAIARRDLLRWHRDDPENGRHWHLARLYAGPKGGSALCAAGATKRKLRSDAGYKEFLDAARNKVPVATSAEFVGRRRQAQRVLRCFRDGEKVGVLIFGMPSVGKSSLAARVANRLPQHETLVVLERYTCLDVFDRLIEAIQPADRDGWTRTWRGRVRAEPRALADALEAMLEDPFHKRPILLVVDDLECILAPSADQEVTPIADAPGDPDAWRQSVAAILRAFSKADSESLLLLTSRYRFTLPDGTGGDLADSLESVPLGPMEGPERAKQWRAAQRVAGTNESVLSAGEPLLDRILIAAAGNPGLQHSLCRPLLENELGAAEAAVAAIEHWMTTGVVPKEDSAAREFFQRASFETYARALDEALRLQLWAATVFSVDLPVPISAVAAVGSAAGVGNSEEAICRLMGLGLFDDWGMTGDELHAAASTLARPLVIAERDPATLARPAVEALTRAWRDAQGEFPYDRRAMEVARLALVCKASPEIVIPAVLAAASHLFGGRHDGTAALQLIKQTLDLLNRQGTEPPPTLLLLGVRCAERIGARGERVSLLERGLALAGLDTPTRARFEFELADVAFTDGDLDRALSLLRSAAATFSAAGEESSAAAAMATIARMIEQRGDIDEAIRIRREQLPVFERLRDGHGWATTLAELADALDRRGEADEALRIRREEALPVLEEIGDVHGVTVTLGKIAEALRQRDSVDEAMRMYREEILPLADRLGDMRLRADVMGAIANVLHQRGDTDEAIGIYRDEVLPAFEQIGDALERALTLGKIADGLADRGDTDEAMSIYQEEVLPVLDRLGNVRFRAVVLGKIGDILQRRGEVDEALRIYRNEVLPAFERLGDVRERATTMGQIAKALERRGHTAEALRILRDEKLPVFKRVGDVYQWAQTMSQIAYLVEQSGDIDEALRIYRSQVLPAFDRLGNLHARAVTLANIASALQRRGNTDEALRMFRGDVLPAFERLRDDRRHARTLMAIANVIQQRGETDEALRVLVEECLPIAQGSGDLNLVALIRFACAQIRIGRGGLETPQAQTIAEELLESFSINLRLQRAEGIAVVGFSLGRMMASAGYITGARDALERAATAAEKLRMLKLLEDIRELQDTLLSQRDADALD